MPVYPGFNNNIRFNEELYHVQTEVISSNEKKVISTLVYKAGHILYSEKNMLDLSCGDNREMVLLQIEEQHKKVIHRIISNEFEPNTRAVSASVDFVQLYAQEPLLKSLDENVKITEAISRLILYKQV